ncbi:hypothetical protein TTHERM_00640000 (macronuclear) [Tetrahymena thermophila SB210]|uniref:Uncharacterized protein n=1 Tax=Tetrahymena thermophila (strain SB210) TaxID=312017 RepID=Q23F33_TETTS|nr:hypothetical protein TTHERM_00640000 [Tetrahymena thermophila SB210]EAR95072.3 hypothetical protein TTHERM_00640000 [Tetrahymena thermophila SB210]|eukprot:XP_001015317.3 hypothetical protein TTHERM_00640000 [Tetrahymena thermophila SB210]
MSNIPQKNNKRKQIQSLDLISQPRKLIQKNEMDELMPVSLQEDLNQDLFNSMKDPKNSINIGLELEQQISVQLKKLNGQVIQKMKINEAREFTKLYPYEIDYLIEENGKLYAVASWGSTQFDLNSLPKEEQEYYLKQYNAKTNYEQRKTRIALTDEQIDYVNQVINMQLNDEIVLVLRILHKTHGIEPVFESEYQSKVFKSFMKQPDAAFLIFLQDIDPQVGLDINAFCQTHQIDMKSVQVNYIKKNKQLKLRFTSLHQYERFVLYYKSINIQIKSDENNQDQTSQVLQALKNMYKQIVTKRKVSEKSNIVEQKGENTPTNIKPLMFGVKDDEISCDKNQNRLKDIQFLSSDRQIELSNNMLDLKAGEKFSQIPQDHIESESLIIDYLDKNKKLNVEQAEQLQPVQKKVNYEKGITQHQGQPPNLMTECLEQKEVIPQDKSLYIKQQLNKIKNENVANDQVLEFIIDFQEILNKMAQDKRFYKTKFGIPKLKERKSINQLKNEHNVYFEKAQQLKGKPFSNQLLIVEEYKKKYSILGFRSFMVAKMINENISMKSISQSKFFNIIA